jgi:hypothetical protein
MLPYSNRVIGAALILLSCSLLVRCGSPNYSFFTGQQQHLSSPSPPSSSSQHTTTTKNFAMPRREILARDCKHVRLYPSDPAFQIGRGSSTTEWPEQLPLTLTDELFSQRRHDPKLAKVMDYARPLREIAERCTPEALEARATFEQKEQALREAAAFAVDYMNRRDAYYFAFYGTLLHLVRHGTPLGGRDDDDIDLGVSVETMYWLMCSPLEELLFVKFGFAVRVSASCNFGQLFHVCNHVVQQPPPTKKKGKGVAPPPRLNPDMLSISKMDAGVDLYIFHHDTQLSLFSSCETTL